MSVDIKGLDQLINKLNKLSNIEAKKAVNEVATIVENHLREQAGAISPTQAQYIGQCETREYQTAYFVDVGLKNENVSFELWKGLWFHNWGYWNHGLNFTGQYYLKMHQMWFNTAINTIEGPSTELMANKLRKEIRKILNEVA